VVITGACGHLGSLLIRRLLARGEPLTLIDNLYTQKQCALFGIEGKVEFIEADVATVEPGVFKDQVVVHLAAIAEPQTSIDKPDYVRSYNTMLTQAVIRGKPKHLIFASSAGVYGPQLGLIIEDCQTFNPQTPYAVGKLKDEALIQLDVANYTIFRFGTLFGPSLGMRFHTAVNKFCWQAATRQPITVWQGAYDQTRPYLDISDACDAIMAPRQGVHNLATCHATVADVIGLIRDCIPSTRIKIVASPPIDQGTYQIWCKLPVHSTLESGIKRTIEYIT
jgi:UDP-glucose 4-epimerase